MSMISTALLFRLKEIAALPRGKQNLPAKHLGIWRLAMRLRELQAASRLDPSVNLKDCPDWSNTKDYLDAALERKEFGVIDEFAKAWLNLRSKAERIDCEAIKHSISGENQAANPATKLCLIRPANKPGTAQEMDVIEAIIEFQGKHGQAPTSQDIIKACEATCDGGISQAKLSTLLKKLGLQGVVPGTKFTRKPSVRGKGKRRK